MLPRTAPMLHSASMARPPQSLEAFVSFNLHVDRSESQMKGLIRGFAIDIPIADRWIGIPAIKRFKLVPFGKSKIRVATPEDVIVMNTVADRPVDRRDVTELRELFGDKLDEKYITHRLRLSGIKHILDVREACPKNAFDSTQSQTTSIGPSSSYPTPGWPPAEHRAASRPPSIAA